MEEESFGPSLLGAFAKVPDSRRGHKGFRHPLAAILALSAAAMFCGARSLNGIAQWGRLQEPEVVHALGFTRDKTPAVSTLHLVFSGLDVEAFERAMKGWAHEHLGDRGEAIAIDGKGLRGIHGEGLPGVRLVAAYAGEAGLVLAQKGVSTDEHEAELTVAGKLLAMVDLCGKLVTMDALYCQRGVCRDVKAGGGDYLVVVKRNQPRLYEDIALLFDEPPVGEVFATAEQRGRHADRNEVRRIWVSRALQGYLDWPGARQVCKIERQVERKGKVATDVRYAVTSRDQISAEDLLRRVRGHWGIENRLHWVRDMTFGEDASRVRTGSGPEVMAALRNAVLGIIRLSGSANVAATLRRNSWRQTEALQLLGVAA